MRPVSACAFAAACCLLILPTLDAAVAAPLVRSGGHGVHGRGFVPARLAARGAVDRGFHRHARSHRDRRFAGGWPGYVDSGVPFASGFVEAGERSPVDVFRSVEQVPVVVGIRDAPAAQPAIIVVGRKGSRVRSSTTKRPAQYAAVGPLILRVGPTGR